MSLSAEALQRHVPSGRASTDPGVYALLVDLPGDDDAVAERWDRHFDERPDYFEQLELADRAVYVGKATNIQRRIEDHRRGDVRQATIVQAFEVVDIYGIWFSDGDLEVAEYNRAAALRRQFDPSVYVHSR